MLTLFVKNYSFLNPNLEGSRARVAYSQFDFLFDIPSYLEEGSLYMLKNELSLFRTLNVPTEDIVSPLI